MGDRVKTFRNVRARVLCVENGCWYAGWTRHLAHDAARIRLKEYVPLASGSQVVGECYGDGVMVKFVGFLEGQMGQEIAIRMSSALTFDANRESVRIGVEGISGALSLDDSTWGLILTDVSPGSLGGISQQPVPAGTTLDLRVDAPNGEILARASVVYCRTEAGPEACHRVGLRISGLSRLDGARWARFIDEMTLV